METSEKSLDVFRALLRGVIAELDKMYGEEICSQNFMMAFLDIAALPPEESRRLMDAAIKTEAKFLRQNILELMRTNPDMILQLAKELSDAKDQKTQEDSQAHEDPKDQVSKF